MSDLLASGERYRETPDSVSPARRKRSYSSSLVFAVADGKFLFGLPSTS